MAEPDWNPDTGGRPLAEILREAGIDTSKAARRRRWDEPDEEPVRQRRADAEPAAGRPAFGRRRSDVEGAVPAASPRAARADSSRAASAGSSRSGAGFPPVRPTQDRRAGGGPTTAAIQGLRADRAPAVPHPSAPLPDIAPGALRDRRAGLREDRDTGRTGVRAARPAQRAVAARQELSSTGPIPVVRPDVDDLDGDASPLAWLRFLGELVIALAAGVGVFFAATLLWEMAPYLALLLVPIAVTGLVAAVGAWRARQGAGPVGPRLLAGLVLAGTLLTIVPAAQLLAAS
ncbi:hypothetical protein [Blastococcus sp. SYSU D01042]